MTFLFFRKPTTSGVKMERVANVKFSGKTYGDSKRLPP